jgi:hypothetical protein
MTKRELDRERKYLLSFFDNDLETPEDVQDLILRILRYDGYGLDDGMFCNKRILLEYLRKTFPKFKKYRNGDMKDQSDGQILRQLNNLIRHGALVLHKHKRVNLVVRGKLWNSRVSQIRKLRKEMSCASLLTTILMGDDPSKRMKFIKDNGRFASLDV